MHTSKYGYICPQVRNKSASAYLDTGIDFYIFKIRSRTSVKLHVSLIKYYTLSWVGLALGIATTKWKIIVDKIEVRK